MSSIQMLFKRPAPGLTSNVLRKQINHSKQNMKNMIKCKIYKSSPPASNQISLKNFFKLCTIIEIFDYGGYG